MIDAKVKEMLASLVIESETELAAERQERSDLSTAQKSLIRANQNIASMTGRLEEALKRAEAAEETARVRQEITDIKEIKAIVDAVKKSESTIINQCKDMMKQMPKAVVYESIDAVRDPNGFLRLWKFRMKNG
jgi:seryl-tRNA synthetase